MTNLRKQQKAELGHELIEAIEGIVNSVEGVHGALEYGTFRGEKTGVRLKDTPEWVALYVAWSRVKRSVA